MGRPFIEKRNEEDIAGGKHEKRQRAGNPAFSEDVEKNFV